MRRIDEKHSKSETDGTVYKIQSLSVQLNMCKLHISVNEWVNEFIDFIDRSSGFLHDQLNGRGRRRGGD